MTMNLRSGVGFRVRAMGLTVLVVCAASALGATGAAAAEHYYRNSIGTRLGTPPRYLGEVPARAAMQGGYFKVETDAAGRVVNVTFLQDGQPASSDIFAYSGAARLPDHDRHFTNGALTGVTAITRDADGQPTRLDFYTGQGVLTGYTTNTYVADHADGANFTPDGTRKSHWQAYFAPDGVEVRQLTYLEQGDSYTESQYDPLRGIETSSKRYFNGQVRITYNNTYDADDDLIRQDLYDENNTWYGAKIYDHNLQTKALFKFLSGETREVRYSYDQRRWATSTQQYEGGVLVCTFLFDRLPDGTVKRTIAQGPDGSLWAEYPNLMVVQVTKDGHPPNSTVGDIHKVGDWW